MKAIITETNPLHINPLIIDLKPRDNKYDWKPVYEIEFERIHLSDILKRALSNNDTVLITFVSMIEIHIEICNGYKK